MKILLDHKSNKEPKVIEINNNEELQYVIIAKDDFIKNISFEIKQNAKLEVLGIFLGDKNNKCEINMVQHHKSPNSNSTCTFKTILKNQSHFKFNGMIKIDKIATETNAYLTQNTLILSDEAKNTSVPSLEINADSVQASHSATTGKVSEEELFYLTSRGLSKQEAEDLIISGFISSVIEKITDKKIQNQVSKLIT